MQSVCNDKKLYGKSLQKNLALLLKYLNKIEIQIKKF